MKRLWKPHLLVWLALVPLMAWVWRNVPLRAIGETFGNLGVNQILVLVGVTPA